MHELSAILNAIEHLQAPAVLATLVKTAGSSYRRPGARMLVLADGRRIGTISAGCLENDLADRAGALSAASAPIVVHYDLSGDAEPIFGFGLGCKGAMTVLLERIEPGQTPQWLTYAKHCLGGGGGVMATIYSSADAQWVPVGKRILLHGRSVSMTQPMLQQLADAIAQAADEALRQDRSRAQGFVVRGIRVDALLEVIQPPIHLLLCGAGDHAIPAAKIAAQLGWRITVHDRREKLATAQRFPEADAILACPIAELPDHVRFDARTVAVILNHNYADDLELLRLLLPMRLPYLGLLGSRQRSAGLLDELARGPSGPTREQLERLHTPVGLDIGAETPAEIALSVVAEIQATLASRPGTPLRQRQGAVHGEGGGENGMSCGGERC
jgi:xanthine/CO dehydrogenase XdhC/CoxF family maturation factor